MRNRPLLFAVLSAAAVFAQTPDRAPAEDGGLPPLVRRDLVSAAGRSFPPVKRDLFSLQAVLPGAEDFRDRGPGFVAGPPAKTEPEEPPAPEFALRYVGFVQNRARTKFVGLVMFEGRPLPVEAGDAVGPGWKVVRLSDKEIEVEGPDGAARIFALEGELR